MFTIIVFYCFLAARLRNDFCLVVNKLAPIIVGQPHGLEMVPHFTERPTSPVQQPRTGQPGWESGMSSPRFAGTRDENVQAEAIDDLE